MGVTRQGYIGKEKDVENNLGDHTSTTLSAGGVGCMIMRRVDLIRRIFNNILFT
ncbi:MAG: hypothetical protein KF896_06095 [Ignavibacteriae bacterium]|nr:hypothetical protein [Ignavibacteriota bacterium]